MRKLDDRSRPGVFIGFADGAKAYRVYDPVSQHVLVSRDVVFDDTRMGLKQERRSCRVGGGGARLRRRADRRRRTRCTRRFCDRGLTLASISISGGDWERSINGRRVLLCFRSVPCFRAIPCFGVALAIPCFGNSWRGSADSN